MSVFGNSINRGREKYHVLYLGDRNLRGSHFCELKLVRNIYIKRKESFMYGLPDFPRKHNNTLSLLGSKLKGYFK